MPDRQEELQKQRMQSYHANNLSGQTQDDGSAGEILRQLSEIDDLPNSLQSDPILGQLTSKLLSTTNLTSEQVRSNEWVRQFLLILYLSHHPEKEGTHGSWRAYAHDDKDAAREPLGPEERTQIEAYIISADLAANRSEDAKAMEEATRTINESISEVKDDSESGRGGLIGKVF